MKFIQSGTRLTLTARTSPPRISRRLASPEAETRSYWLSPPWRISVTISFEEPAYFELTWHPVCCSNGLTHCGWVYPSQAITLSTPSPLPMWVITLVVGVEELPPHAAIHSEATS